MVNRAFTAPVIVSGFPDFWKFALRGALGERASAALVHVSEGEDLGLQPGQADLVVHALGLHWANDPVGQLIQCRRALRPDGLLLCALFGGETLTELRRALLEAEADQTGGASPRVAPMGEIRDLGALMQRAGFALPVADATTQEVSYASPLNLMRDLRDMGEGNALAARLRHFTRRSVLLEAARRYEECCADPAEVGRVLARFEIVVLTGWAPHPSQQQPLSPGSASVALSEALRGKSRH